MLINTHTLKEKLAVLIGYLFLLILPLTIIGFHVYVFQTVDRQWNLEVTGIERGALLLNKTYSDGARASVYTFYIKRENSTAVDEIVVDVATYYRYSLNSMVPLLFDEDQHQYVLRGNLHYNILILSLIVLDILVVIALLAFMRSYTREKKYHM